MHHPGESAIHTAHIKRLRTWDVPINERHTALVVKRAMESPEPVAHDHEHDEMGACVECDAAAVRRMVAESHAADDNQTKEG